MWRACHARLEDAEDNAQRTVLGICPLFKIGAPWGTSSGHHRNRFGNRPRRLRQPGWQLSSRAYESGCGTRIEMPIPGPVSAIEAGTEFHRHASVELDQTFCTAELNGPRLVPDARPYRSSASDQPCVVVAGVAESDSRRLIETSMTIRRAAPQGAMSP